MTLIFFITNKNKIKNMLKLSIYVTTALFIFASCKKDDKNNTDTVKANYEIAVNGNFQLSLTSNGSTGYSWTWINKQVVTTVDTFDFKYIIDDPAKVGGDGKEIWNFKGIKAGVDTIKLEYKRSWDANSTIDSKKIVVKVK
ncbi:MAG: hypothetical protein JWN56_1984 [Sphingobacteriales bacterium]|nr:hypothetical protein [Sphingobacteriales bacterium]